MWALLRETWQHAVGLPDNPVYRRELSGWSYGSILERLRRGCVPLIALVMTFTTCLCMVPVLFVAIEDPVGIALLGYFALGGLYLSGEIVLLLAGLIATALTATVVSSEVEAQTYGMLRMTTLEPRGIVLGKYGAAFKAMHIPIAVTMFTRVGSLLGVVVYSVGLGIGAFLGFLLNTAPTAPATPAPPQPPTAALPPGITLAAIPDFLLSGLSLIALLVVVVVWLAYFFMRPAVQIGLFSALGLYASALSKSRSAGLITAIALRAGYAMGSYFVGQVISNGVTLLLLPLSILSAANPAFQQLIATQTTLVVLVGAVTAVGTALVLFALQIGLIALVLHLSIRRAQKLPFMV